MKIDPNSNRGVRCKSADPDPVFSDHFDEHGNQLKLQPGAQPLAWDSRDQLTRVTLLQHSNGCPTTLKPTVTAKVSASTSAR
jgi:insecticidal toxin complex protein TccC